MDSQLVEKIVHEVKSQGVFDEFRRDSMADVDTKPAYQNLRQRVETSVKKFLSEQKWTPETNKNQLRDRLRRHITESGYLDVGVERIVDQVVNPKICSVFQPRIEEIAYHYLGIPQPPKKFEPPPPPLIHPLPPLPMKGAPLKVETTSLLPTDLEQVSPDSDKGTVKSECKEDETTQDDDEKTVDEEYESPPFEPLVKCSSPCRPQMKEEKDDKFENPNKDNPTIVTVSPTNGETVETVLASEVQESSTSGNTIDMLDSEKEASRSLDAVVSQESQLSRVSSDSRISVAFQESQDNVTQDAVSVNISEEAQMPKFNENSSEPNGGGSCNVGQLHFDIKKDEIKFEGTERKANISDGNLSPSILPTTEKHPSKETALSLNFSANRDSMKMCNTFSGTENSFGSSLENTVTVQPTNDVDNESVDVEKKETYPMTNMGLMPPITLVEPLSHMQHDKDLQAKHSSSTSSLTSSKHKRRSKDRRKSKEREREHHRGEKSDRNKDRHHKKNKHSTSSSSYNKHSSSSSHKSSSGDTDKYISKHPKHSTSSSSSETHDSSKREHCDTEKRHGSSATKEHSSLSTSKRNERKDDHNEAKRKSERRKSTDSNDDDEEKNSNTADGSGTHSERQKSSQNKSKSTSNVDSMTTFKSTENDSKQQKSSEEVDFHHRNKVVILNDILQHPNTNFIELDTAAHPAIPVQIVTSSNKTSVLSKNSIIPNPDNVGNGANDLLFFEETDNQFTMRLKLLNTTMNLCRRAINSLRFDDLEDDVLDLCGDKDPEGKRIESKKQQGMLNINNTGCSSSVNNSQQDYEHTPRKRLKSHEISECKAKTSPTPSDSSVNSKENEDLDKNNVLHKSKNSLLERRHNAVQKLSQQQRYSSEDLYKPRPILGQRSKRRGMDSIV